MTVHCQSLGGALADVGAELGYVKYGPDGPEPKTLIKREACADLRSYRGNRDHPSRDEVIAVHVLTHEAMHMKGLTNEQEAECAAIQRDRLTAQLPGREPAAGAHAGPRLLAHRLPGHAPRLPLGLVPRGNRSRRAPGHVAVGAVIFWVGGAHDH